MSSSGQYQTAITVANGIIYTSTNYGVTWTQRINTAQVGVFTRISASGQYQIACCGITGLPGQIYVSRDYGFDWTPVLVTSALRPWSSVAVSSNGQYLAATINGGQIYVCNNPINVGQGKSFIIDHPIDSNKYLVHECLEGPERGVYYRGEAIIPEGSSEITITLPEYVDKIAFNFSVHITPIYNGKIRNLYSDRVVENKFTVYGEPGAFYWIVYGTRAIINPEPNKSNVKVDGSGPYKYITY